MTHASIYVTDYDEHVQRATTYVSEEPKSFRVTYRGEDGKPFRVNVHQKPNPIGFTAKMPGGSKRKG